jgi:hypothetical protein
MAHGLDTNMNEAFNNICTWFAPKNKVFAGAYSLHNRISFAVGINSVGVLQYFTRLYRKLGITMTENVVHYLTKKEDKRARKLAKVKTADAKKEKNKRKHDKLNKDVQVAKMELHKRQGTYRKGMNLDDPYGDEGAAAARPPAKRQKASTGFCEWCGKKSHLTKASKKCIFFQMKDAPRKYRKIDGTLLSGPPQLVAPIGQANALEDEEDPMVESALLFGNMDDGADCDDFDRQPLIPMPGEVGFDADLFLATDTAGEGDDDSVDVLGVAGGGGFIYIACCYLLFE